MAGIVHLPRPSAQDRARRRGGFRLAQRRHMARRVHVCSKCREVLGNLPVCPLCNLPTLAPALLKPPLTVAEAAASALIDAKVALATVPRMRRS